MPFQKKLQKNIHISKTVTDINKKSNSHYEKLNEASICKNAQGDAVQKTYGRKRTRIFAFPEENACDCCICCCFVLAQLLKEFQQDVLVIHI